MDCCPWWCDALKLKIVYTILTFLECSDINICMIAWPFINIHLLQILHPLDLICATWWMVIVFSWQIRSSVHVRGPVAMGDPLSAAVMDLGMTTTATWKLLLVRRMKLSRYYHWKIAMVRTKGRNYMGETSSYILSFTVFVVGAFFVGIPLESIHVQLLLWQHLPGQFSLTATPGQFLPPPPSNSYPGPVSQRQISNEDTYPSDNYPLRKSWNCLGWGKGGLLWELSGGEGEGLHFFWSCMESLVTGQPFEKKMISMSLNTTEVW